MRRTGLLIAIFALLVVACDNDTSPASGSTEFLDCMEEAGFSEEDLEREEITLTPDEREERGLPREGDQVTVSEIDWELELARSRCGDGPALDDPEMAAERSAQSVALTSCMRTRGWDEFPDPQPTSSPIDEGLIHARIDLPEDPEERQAFMADLQLCGDEVGTPVFDE